MFDIVIIMLTPARTGKIWFIADRTRGTLPVFQNEALLRLDIEHREPADFCGPLGGSPILNPAGREPRIYGRGRKPY